jgi:hypothetical protein
MEIHRRGSSVSLAGLSMNGWLEIASLNREMCSTDLVLIAQTHGTLVLMGELTWLLTITKCQYQLSDPAGKS